MSKGHITFAPEVVETIRIRLITWMRTNRFTHEKVARMVGRKPNTLSKFIAGDERSSMAADLCIAIPELSEGVCCPYCRRPMPGVVPGDSGITPTH